MNRTELRVPFSEKEEAKKQGAKWDSEKKVWYVPEALPLTGFSKWLPLKPKMNVRSERYFTAETFESCWSCKNITPVLGVIVPAGADHREETTWFQLPEPAAVYYIYHLPPALETFLTSRAARYAPAFSKTAKGTYYLNHCTHCGAKQGDFHMYCEPGGAFFPRDPEEASLITLEEIKAPFEACAGGVTYGVAEFLYMNRRLEKEI